MRVRLLPGFSAYRYASWSLFPLWGGAPFMPLAMVIYVATESSAAWQSPFVWAAFLLGFALIGAGLLLLLAAWLKGCREVGRHYTTMVAVYRRFKQVDPRSGFVIRRAGDAFLDRAPAGFDGRPVTSGKGARS